MKKFMAVFTAIIFFISCGCSMSLAEEVLQNDDSSVIEASVTFDWVNMEQVKRDEKIEQYKSLLFSSEEPTSIKKSEFRSKYKDFLKDSLLRTHYRLISNGASETKDFNMSGFFRNFRNEPLLYAYALQPKQDIRHVYYYSAMGGLAYVDDISENYPNFPYFSKQYRSNGKLAGVIYFENHDTQYTFDTNGKFKGVWYKDKMYDKNGKEILTRTNW